MKRFSISAQILVTLVVLAGCYKPSPYNPPDPMANVNFDFLKGMKTCDTPTTVQKVSDEARKDAIVVEDEIENMDYEIVDCDGSIKSKGHGPVRMLQKKITIDAPAQLNREVNFVTAANVRTCTSQKIRAWEDSTLEELQSTKGKDADPLAGLSFASRSGKTRLSLIGSDLEDFVMFNVLEGDNVLTLTYHGKCLKYDPNAKEDLPDHVRCKEAEVLATKSILVEVKVKHTETKGLRKIDICTTKTSKNP